MRICSFSDARDYRIRVGSREFRFDFSERFGPMAIGARGEFLAFQPGKNFLEAVSWWCRQGKLVDRDGWCIWEQPTRTETVYRLGRQLLTEGVYREALAKGVVPELQPESWTFVERL